MSDDALPQVVAPVMDMLRAILPNRCVGISRVDVDSGTFECIGLHDTIGLGVRVGDTFPLASMASGLLEQGVRDEIVTIDAGADPVLRELPSLALGQLRTYLAMPVWGPDGRLVAVINVVDRGSVTICDEQLVAVRALASLLGDLIESRTRIAGLEADVVARGRRVSSTVHDLRTPVAVVAGIAETLIRFSSTPALVDEFSGRLFRTARELAVLVDGLLELEQGATAIDEPVEVNLEMLVGELLDDAGILVRDGDVKVKGFGTGTALLPMRGVRRLLLNLVGNAAKAATSGVLEINAVATTDGVRFIVQDQGPGLGVAQATRLRGDGGDVAALGDQGNGLGLSIVADLAQRLGATVDVVTSPLGTQISVTFPVVRTDEPAALHTH